MTMIRPKSRAHLLRRRTLAFAAWIAIASALPSLACARTPDHRHADPVPVTTGSASLPLDPVSLARVAREPVRAEAHGKPLHCEGRRLDALLRAAGAMPAGRLPGPMLARYVRVHARDGYRVLYALAELDPGTGNRAVYLVDRCDGKPLGDADGPLRLIAPADVRPARWARQVNAITVEDAP